MTAAGKLLDVVTQGLNIAGSILIVVPAVSTSKSPPTFPYSVVVSLSVVSQSLSFSWKKERNNETHKTNRRRR